MELTGLVGQRQICARWGISKSFYRSLQQREDWPAPIKIGRRTFYPVEELEEWLQKQAGRASQD